MAVGRDVRDGEVRDNKREYQRTERQGDAQGGSDGSPLGRAGQHRAAPDASRDPHAGLQDRQGEGENQGEGTKLDDQETGAPVTALASGRHSPLALRLSATSRGM